MPNLVIILGVTNMFVSLVLFVYIFKFGKIQTLTVKFFLLQFIDFICQGYTYVNMTFCNTAEFADVMSHRDGCVLST